MTAIFNRQSLYEQVEGDEALLRELVAMFLEQAPARVAEMEQAVAAGDAFRLKAEAHTLKGAAAAVCAEAVRDAATKVELAGLRHSLEEAAFLLASLRRELARFQAVVQGQDAPSVRGLQ